MEINTIKLENEKDYMIIDTIVKNDQKYFVLVNEEDYQDICIRKVIVDNNNKEYVVKLDDVDEFDEVITLFTKKHEKEEEPNE